MKDIEKKHVEETQEKIEIEKNKFEMPKDVE